MSKKITLKEYNEIGESTLRNWVKPLCNYDVEETCWGYEIKISLKKIYFILLFIPLNLFQLVNCIVNSGLKSFTLYTENFMSEACSWGSVPWEKIKEICDRK